MNEDLAGLPQDVQDIIALREHVTELRTKKNFTIDVLPEPPLHVPGCDDVHHRFDWWRIADTDDVTIGYFHTVKGVEL